MMRQLYSIHDVETHVFMDGFFDSHDVEARRQFSQVVNNEQTKINRFPEAYDLYRLGTMESNTGRLVSLDIPERICGALDLLKPIPSVGEVRSDRR